MDYTYVIVKGYSSSYAVQQILSNFNSVNGVYAVMNINIGILQIRTVASYDEGPGTGLTGASQTGNWNRPCDPSYPILSRLNDFSFWRGTIDDNTTGIWHLMSNCP
jgi:hypothetical protein